MELCLSLGEKSKSQIEIFKEDDHNTEPNITIAKNTHQDNLDFCMGLGLKIGGRENEKSQENIESKGDEEDYDDDDGTRDEHEATPVQLNLLPMTPVPRQTYNNTFSHLQALQPWSSDNGCSENGSSNNLGGLATVPLGLDFSRSPAPAAEEVSSERASPRASDDDELRNGLNNPRKKLRLSKEQSAFLEESFKEHNTLNPKQKLALAKQLNLSPRQVEVWFQNRRARTKLKQTEVDFEYLKRCCDGLTEENRRLHKEIQDLRTLNNNSNNSIFYNNMQQIPATTLTMCPSCERVTTATTPPPTATTTNVVGSISAVDSKRKADGTFSKIFRPRFNFPFSSQSGSTSSHINDDQPQTS